MNAPRPPHMPGHVMPDGSIFAGAAARGRIYIKAGAVVLPLCQGIRACAHGWRITAANGQSGLLMCEREARL